MNKINKHIKLYITFTLFLFLFIRNQSHAATEDYRTVINNSKENPRVFDSDKATNNQEKLSNNVITEDDIKITQDILQKTTTTTKSSSSPVSIILIILGSIVGIGIIGTIMVSLLNREKKAEILFRDQKRKHDLEKIRYSLSAFAKTYGRYPDSERGEFLDLLKQMDSFPIDPLADKETGFNNQRYNYNYDNQSLDLKEKGRSNTNYYRLWCHLENSIDPDVNKLYAKSYKNIYLKTCLDPLNPLLLLEPQKEIPKNIKQKPQKEISIPVKPVMVSNVTVTEISTHRKESLLQFILIITAAGLIASAIINGILYYMVQTK